MPSPQARYERDLLKSDFQHDPAQAQAVGRLHDLWQRLIDAPSHPAEPNFWQRVRGQQVPRWSLQKGLYFWGGVGRGKTYLMDTFYETLPFNEKMRVHFHRFMRRVHQELTALKGEKNPLDRVGEKLASEARVICFDEFFVVDITDAMILARLLESLFAHGVTLVATSNIVPDGLYRNGLQRDRFLPAIDLLNQHAEVVNVDGGVDYRLRLLERAELFHSPLDESADASLLHSFESLVPDPSEIRAAQEIEVEGRAIEARYVAEDVAWFDFKALCDGPRSQNDYIELARIFHAVLISAVPALDATKEDQARRFINLVDEFYDRNVKLILSSARPLESIYSGQQLVFEFERTRSRLLEMQSRDYLARAHKP